MFSFKSKSASLKDGILDQIGEQIKALQLGKQNAEDDGIKDYKVKAESIHLQCLLDLLDHVMLHGLDNVEKGYWPYVVTLTHSATVNLITNHPQVTNDLDKGRVWIFVTLCEGSLESYMRLFLEGQKEIKKFYARQSFLRDKERLLVLQTLVSGLDFVDFDLDLNCPYLGYGGYLAPKVQATSPASSQSTSSRASSSSSTLIGSSPTNSNDTFDFTTTPTSQTDVKTHQGNGNLKNSPLTNKKVSSNQGSNSKKDSNLTVSNVRALTEEAEQLSIMDPKYATVNEDSVRAFADAAYVETGFDFRSRGGSDVSGISMDDPSGLITRTYIKKKKVSKNKPRSKEESRKYPEPGDLEHSMDDDAYLDHSKGSAGYSSYLHTYRRDVDSASIGSADSLDQFCRDSDFGSSLTLEGNPQSTVRECVNEQPAVEEQKQEETKSESQNIGNGDSVSNEGLEFSTEYEGIIMGLPKRPVLQDQTGKACDVSVDTNTLLVLSLEIFKDHNERIERMLRTATGHQFGQLQCAYVMITDVSIYLLRKVKFRGEASFHTDLFIEFNNIKSIEIGLNCQTVAVISKKESFVITFGDEAVSRSFITTLTSQMARASPSLSLSNLVSSSALQQESQIVKWMTKDKHLNPGLPVVHSIHRRSCFDRSFSCRYIVAEFMSSPSVSGCSLVHWCGLTGPDSIIEVISYQSLMEGTLEFKSQNLLRSSRWTEGYFVLTNGTLWQYQSKNEKTPKNIIDLRESQCAGCRQIHDADRKFAFEIVSSDGMGSLLVLAAKNEHEACEWIFKICQSIAESYDDEEDQGRKVMKCVPCNLITTKDKIIICLSQPNVEDEFKLITSCAVQNITKIYVDNEYRNYCIIKFEYNETGSSEGSWFVSFNSEFELGKFEHTIAEAWRQLFKVDLQFLVLGKNETRDRARERIDKITQTTSQ